MSNHWKFIFFTLIVCIKGSSQITFQKAYGGVGEEINECLNKSIGVLCKTDNNGYAIFNTSYSFTNTMSAFLVKIKQNGDTNFTKAYVGSNGPFNCIGRSVMQNPDGGFILGIWYNGSNIGTSGQGLIRTNSIGDTLWCRRFAPTYSASGVGYFGARLSDNSFISSGFFQDGNFQATLCKVNSSGNLVFGKRYFLNSNNSVFYSSTETSDGGILSTGSIRYFSLGLSTDKILITKTDKLGNLKWAKAYDNGYSSFGQRLIELSDKSIVTIGYQENSFQTDKDIVVIKTDSIGNPIFNKVICDSIIQYGCSLTSDAQDNIYLVGYSGYMGSVVIKMSLNGNVLFKKAYPFCDVGNDIVSTNDKGFAFSGMTPYLSNNGTDLYLVKADSLGFAGCSTNDCTLTVSNASYSTITIPLSSINDLLAFPIALEVRSGAIVSTMCYNEPINTKVHETKISNSIIVYPNPASQEFIMQTNGNEIQTLELFDLNGRLLFTKYISDQANIDVRNLSEGVYNLTIKTSINTINKKLVIVR